MWEKFDYLLSFSRVLNQMKTPRDKGWKNERERDKKDVTQ